MSSIHELLKQVYPLKLRMELFNAIWFNWRADIKEKDQQITDLQSQLAIREKALLNIAKQLLLVYYDEGCTYGDYIVGRTDNPVETVENYIEQAKEMLENE